ncbi:MAG: hypothetical protein GF419_04585 [Ignavibacteriales bacterium]|nr:hypothetical protein [Ignavibacteriales bacterium]
MKRRSDNGARDERFEAFLEYGKENFGDAVEREDTAPRVFAEAATLAELELPPEFEWQRYDAESVRLVVIAKHPVLLRHDRALTERLEDGGAAVQRLNETRRLFHLWAESKTPKDADYYGRLVLDRVEQAEGAAAILPTLFAGIICSRDRRLVDIETARTMFDAAKSVTSALGDDDLAKRLLAVVQTAEALQQLERDENEDAADLFQLALESNPHELSAAFGAALAAAKTGDDGKALHLIKEIVAKDLARLSRALKNSSVSQFAFFLEHAAAPKIFDRVEFVVIEEGIRETIEGVKGEIEDAPKMLHLKLNRLGDAHVEDYYNAEINSELFFFRQFAGKFEGVKNAYILSTSESLMKKFDDLLEWIEREIANVFEARVEREVARYNEIIRDNESEYERIKGDLDGQNARYEEEAKRRRDSITRKYDKTIEATRESLEGIDKSKEFKPSERFKRSMIGNLAVSGVMFLVGGFAHVMGLISSGEDGNFFTAGLKWGVAVFVVGALVSAIIAFMAGDEASSKRKRLREKLESLEDERKRESKSLESALERKTRTIRELGRDRLRNVEKDLDRVRKERKAIVDRISGEQEAERNALIRRVRTVNEKR